MRGCNAALYPWLIYKIILLESFNEKHTKTKGRTIKISAIYLCHVAVGLLKRGAVVFCCLIIVGCDRYSQKPLCSAVIDDSDLGTFSYGSDGTVLDWKTDTIWYRCPGGSYFSQDTCSSDRLKLSWIDAMDYATELSEISGVEWRLATLPEIRSIISPTLRWSPPLTQMSFLH